MWHVSVYVSVCERKSSEGREERCVEWHKRLSSPCRRVEVKEALREGDCVVEEPHEKDAREKLASRLAPKMLLDNGFVGGADARRYDVKGCEEQRCKNQPHCDENRLQRERESG